MPIFTRADTESAALFDPKTGFHSDVVVTGEQQQLIWAKLEPGGNYALHTHTHEQISVVLEGRMRLTVGDEVRDVGPGDMWYAPAHVPHGGEVLDGEPVVFVDIYAPPNVDIVERMEKRRSQSKP